MKPSALDHIAAIRDRLGPRAPALFLDYDGTLTPIVEHPALARLSGDMRARLRRLAHRITVAVVSGRDLDDVRNMVQLDELIYAGSHGFDIAGPDGLHMQQQDARAALADLDSAERDLHARSDDINGMRIERKRFAIAVHYRQVAEPDVTRVESLVDELAVRYGSLRKRGGKMIFELQPNVEWDKGRAVRWLMNKLGIDDATHLPIYIGDDVTDEDAFRALKESGIGIRVGSENESTDATYHLADPNEVGAFLDRLSERLH